MFLKVPHSIVAKKLLIHVANEGKTRRAFSKRRDEKAQFT